MEALNLKSARMTILGLLCFFLLAFAPHAFAFSNGQAATLVIGQSNFTASGSALTSTGLSGASTSAFDSSGNLWVADTANSRVLEYTAPFSNGQAATLVIGQSNFTASDLVTTSAELSSPIGLAFDSSGDLWVADSGGNRILEYTAPFSTHEAASLVIGQPGFRASRSAANLTGLSQPNGIAFDSHGNLWVADYGNNRVIEYMAPFSTHEAASLVIGQSSFTGSALATNSTGLKYPTDVAFDSSGNLWVADSGNSRILEYAAPFSTGEAASLVIGQSSFTGSAVATNSTGLWYPPALAFDSSGNLWVADYGSNRVLEYMAPFSTHEAASLVIGQPNFATKVEVTNSTQLDQPNGVAFDSHGNLWVSDSANDRILEYSSTVTTPEFPAVAVPIVFAVALAATLMIVAPQRRYRQL